MANNANDFDKSGSGFFIRYFCTWFLLAHLVVKQKRSNTISMTTDEMMKTVERFMNDPSVFDRGVIEGVPPMPRHIAVLFSENRAVFEDEFRFLVEALKL